MSILVDTVDGCIRVLSLNRPAVLNATSLADIAELDDLLGAAERDPAIRCVVLTGAGGAFCAGNDIHEMRGMTSAQLTLAELRRREPTWHWSTADVPTIAAINGVCYGNGALLAIGSDLRVGGPATKIKITATVYGHANLTWNLPALIGESHARDLLLTGRVVEGPEAHRIGLLNRYADDGDVLSCALELAATIAKHPPEGPRTIKQLINQSHGTTLQGRFDREHAIQIAGLQAGHADDAFADFNARSAARRASRPEGPAAATRDGGA